MFTLSTARPRPRGTARGLSWAFLSASVLIAGCESSPAGPVGEARIRVLLTDFPLEAIASAEVSISRVYLTGGGQGQVDLFNNEEAPHELDLLDLQGGVTFDLTGEVPVPEGSYGQLRFVVEEAQLALADGFTFSDGSSERDLTVPSTFFRVILNGEAGEEDDSGSLALEGGETTAVLVDFDVSQSFVFQGPPDSPVGVQFKPVLRQLATE